MNLTARRDRTNDGLCRMELRWLQSFLVLADVLHFGRAAAALHLSQSALSVQIRKLEAALQITLFARDRRAVTLTAAGRVYREEVRQSLRGLEAAGRKARHAAGGETGTLRLTFVSTAAMQIIPAVIRHYKEVLPGVELRMRNLPTAHQIIVLLRQEADVGFIRLPFELEEITVQPLHREPFVCFLPRDHPLARSEQIDPRQLRREPFVAYERRQAPGFYDRILSICLDSGFSPDVLQEASEMQTILSMVAAGLGVAILPCSAGRLGVTQITMRPLAGDWLPSELGVATLRTAAEEPLLLKFGQVLAEVQQSW